LVKDEIAARPCNLFTNGGYFFGILISKLSERSESKSRALDSLEELFLLCRSKGVDGIFELNGE